MRQFFCILCDGFIYQKNEILCAYCFLKISKEKIKIREDKGFKHLFLFSWSSRNDDFCRKLVYSLKNKPSAYFEQLIPFFSPYIGDLASDLICPETNSGPYNHAKSIALSMKKLFNFSGVSTIKTSSEGSQKRKKNRQERFNDLRVRLEDPGNWVFVDDVFVTGATCYKIAEQAGTRPHLALTLFYKEKEY